VTAISAGNFNGCKSLTHVSLPDTIESIGKYSFDSCTSLKSFVIPAKVKSIDFDAFYDCPNLESIAYLGTEEPEFGQNIFKNDNKLKTICVPESYTSTSFCGKNITCKSSSCRLMNSECHDLSEQNGQCTFTRKQAASDWEKQTSDCVNFVCDNDEGMVAKSKCDDNSPITLCLDDKCFDSGVVSTKTWTVVIEFDNIDVLVISSDDFEKELVDLTNYSDSIMKAVIEYDDNGVLKRVIVYVDDESQARNIADAVNKLDKSGSCEGVLCKSESAIVVDLKPVVPVPSCGSYYHGTLALLVAMLFLLLSIN